MHSELGGTNMDVLVAVGTTAGLSIQLVSDGLSRRGLAEGRTVTSKPAP